MEVIPSQIYRVFLLKERWLSSPAEAENKRTVPCRSTDFRVCI